MSQDSPLSFQNANNRETEWGRAASLEKDERPMSQVKKLVLKGGVDVVFFRGDTPQLIVAGESDEAISRITTRVSGDKLVIEQEGVTVSGAGSSVHVVGDGNIVAGRDIYVGGIRMQFNGPVGNFHGGDVVNAGGQCIVGIVLPEAPKIRINGSSDITLYDLKQSDLDIDISGSGDVTAYGQVEHLEADVQGSGDIDTTELKAASANLTIAGSGDMDVYVTQSVKARIAGSGDIKVRGNPPSRDHSVAGSGKVKFK